MIRIKVHTIVLLAVFTVMLTSCGGHSYPHQIAVADSLCEANPDSAVRYLRALRPHFDKAQKNVRMYYRLLCIKATDKTYVPQKSDKEILQIVDYYEHGGDKKLLPMAYYYAGSAYRDLNDAPKAVIFFNKALNGLPEDADSKFKSNIYNQKGQILKQQGLHNDALRMLKLAYDCDCTRKDTIEMINSLRDIGNLYESKNKNDSCLVYYERAYLLAKKINKKASIEIMGQMALYYCDTKQYEKASKCLQPAFSNIDNINAGPLYFIALKIYMAKKNYSLARYYCSKLETYGSIGEKTYAKLCKLKLRLHDERDGKSQDLLVKYEQFNDSVDAITQAQAVAKINALYKSKQKDKENARLQAENRHKTFVIVLFVIALVTIVSGSTYLYRRRKRRYSILSARMNYMKTVMEEIRSKSELNIEENEKKVKALEAEMNSLTEENGSLRADLEERKSAIVSSTAAAIKEMQEEKRHQINICQSDVYQSFTSALNSPHEKMPIDAERWKELERVVNAEYVNFTAKLFSLCTMNAQDYRVCLLLKAGMRVDDISKLTHHSRQSVTSTRIRLYEKTFGTKGEAKKWDEVIASL